jgi:hypothetical protein
MLTTDDLKKIQGVVQNVVDKRADELEHKMEVRFDAVEKRFDRRFEGVDKKLENIETQMEQDRHDWSQFFNDAGIFFDQLVKRIKKLEDKKGFSKN